MKRMKKQFMSENRMPEEKRILRGLSKEEVEERFIEGFVNKQTSARRRVQGNRKSNVFTYFNFIFLVITILLCVVGSSEPDFPANHHRKYADWNYSGIAGEEVLDKMSF